MKTRLTDQQVINRFMDHPDNTHNVAISSSVGIALLALGKRYPVVIEDLDNQYNVCKQWLEQYVQQLPENREKGWARQPAIDLVEKICTKAESHSDEARDTDELTLYLEEEQSSSTFSFPLKEVFSLVVLAIKDQAAYVQHYNEKSAKSRLQQAEDDLPLRIESFLTSISNIVYGTCHHGVRNELVMCLNHAHEDVYLIEDCVAEALRFAREYLLTEIVQNKNLTASAVLSWIAEDDLQPILNNRQTLKVELIVGLEKFFASYGIAPEMINLAGSSTPAFIENVTFDCSPLDHACLYAINKLFASLHSQPEMAAVESIKSYIKSHDFLHDQKASFIVTHFYNLYELNCRIDKIRMILAVVPAGKDFLEEYRQFCQVTVPGKSAECNIFEVAIEEPEAVRYLNDNLAIQEQKQKLAKIEQDNLEDYISNFFAKWCSCSEDESGILYGQLLEIYYSDFRKKLLLTDAELDELFRAHNTTDGFIDLTPYLLGRIFLHAFLARVWSEKFSEKMLALKLHDHGSVLNSQFGSRDNENFVESSVKGIKDDLIALTAVRGGFSNQHHLVLTSGLITPDTAASQYDWEIIFYQLMNGNYYPLAQRLFSKHSMVILSYVQTEEGFLSMLNYMGMGRISFNQHAAHWVRKAFSMNCIRMLLDVSNDPVNIGACLKRRGDLVKTASDAALFFDLLPPFDSLELIIETLDSIRVRSIEKDFVLAGFTKWCEAGIVNSLQAVMQIASRLFYSDRYPVFELMPFHFVTSIDLLKDMLMNLDCGDRGKIARRYIDLIRAHSSCLPDLLNLLGDEDGLALAFLCEGDVHSVRLTMSVINKLDPNNRLPYFQGINEKKRRKILDNPSRLKKLLNELPINHRLEVVRFSQANVSLESFNEIRKVVALLPAEHRFEFINHLTPDRLRMIFDEGNLQDDFLDFLLMLPYTDCVHFLMNQLFIKENSVRKNSLFFNQVHNKFLFKLALDLIVTYPFSYDWIDHEFFSQFPSEWLHHICKLLVDIHFNKSSFTVDAMLDVIINEVMHTKEEKQKFIVFMISNARNIDALRYFSIHFIQKGYFLPSCNAPHLVTNVITFNKLLREMPKPCRGRFALAYPSFFGSLSTLLSIAKCAEDNNVLVDPSIIKSDYALLRLLHTCFSTKNEMQMLLEYMVSKNKGDSIYQHHAIFLPSINSFDIVKKLKRYIKTGLYNEKKPDQNTLSMLFASIMSRLAMLVEDKANQERFDSLDNQFSQLTDVDDNIVDKLELLTKRVLSNKKDSGQHAMLTEILNDINQFRENSGIPLLAASSSC